MMIKKITLGLMVLAAVIAAIAFIYIGQLEEQRKNQSAALKEQALTTLGEVSSKVESLQALVDQLAKRAAASGDLLSTQGRVGIEELLNKDNVEGLLKVRVVLPNRLDIDMLSDPPMGYADLEMIRASAASAKPVLAEIHMLGSKGEHIALVSPIKQDDVLRGFILASFDVGVIQALFRSGMRDQQLAWIELKQDALFIVGDGNASFKKSEVIHLLRLSGAHWQIKVRRPSSGLPLTQQDVFYYLAISWLVIILLGLLASFLTNKDRREVVKSKLKPSQQFKKAQAPVVEVVKPDDTGSLSGERDEGSSGKAGLLETKTDDAQSVIFQKDDAIQVSTQLSTPKAIFRAYDIRGVVDVSLTEEGVYEIGLAIGTEVLEAGQKGIIIARDGRLHSERLSQSLVKGLLATGCDVCDIGQVPTPVLYYATHNLSANSGVMITGSHNPAEYNGVKVVIDGQTLSGDEILNLYHRIEKRDFAEGEGEYQEQMMLPEYIGAISSDVKMGRMMKVVVDCGNGVAGEAAPMLLSTLGCDVIPLFCEIDGSFPNHHPDPSKPENLQQLIEKVKEEEAELGLAFDGDGDRLGVVDSEGNIIWPDRQLMLYAIDVLSRQVGADIVFDVKCSKNVEKVIAAHGGRALMSKTGHSLMKAKMKQTGAELGGEMSGHIFFKERWFGFDDGLYTAARLLEILSSEFRATAEIFADLPDSLSTPELNVSLQEGENVRFIDKLMGLAKFDDAKLVTIDGLRVEFTDGWGLVRASNTTPSLVLRFEADNNEAMIRIQASFRQLMLEIKPDIELPF